MNYWLIKSEPNCYSIEDFRKENITVWSGVRNYAARNNLRAMQLDDLCLFYRSVHDPAVEGLCKVVKIAYPDPTDENWWAVDVKFIEKFNSVLPLKTIRQDPFLADMELLKNSRLSVQKVLESEFLYILKQTQKI